MTQTMIAEREAGADISPSSRRYSAFESATAEANTVTGGAARTKQLVVRPSDDLEGRLFDARADFKVEFAKIAMHISADWRSRLFAQIDSLLELEEWDPGDSPVSRGASICFIRTMLYLKPQRRPGLGATHDGNLLAAWTEGNDRLTVICRPRDSVRWLISRKIDGHPEIATGDTVVGRLRSVLHPYDPERWLGGPT